MALKPRMLYFGPWSEAGHYFFDEHGRSYGLGDLEAACPWGHDGNKAPIDGCLQPGCRKERDYWVHVGVQVEGQTLVHYLKGWTAISFWDRTIDKRGGCNSTYMAEGVFNFDEMVAMAKERFAERWNRMKFEVVEAA